MAVVFGGIVGSCTVQHGTVPFYQLAESFDVPIDKICGTLTLNPVLRGTIGTESVLSGTVTAKVVLGGSLSTDSVLSATLDTDPVLNGTLEVEEC